MTLRNNLLRTNAILLLGFAIFNGCKKTDSITKEEQTAKAIAADTEKLRAIFAQERKDEPLTYMIDANLPGKGFYGDLEGNHIDLNSLRQHRQMYDCPDPADDYFSQEVISIIQQFTCGQGYRIEVAYEVSVLYNLLTTNPNNGSQLSRGRIRLKNLFGTVTHTISSITPVTITNLGADPSDGTLTRFRVVFKSDYIPEATFSGTGSIEPGLFCYTDCDMVSSLNIPYSNDQSITVMDINSQPCLRVDKVRYSPTTHAVSGCNAIPSACVPFGYVFPDYHQIQWLNGSVWTALKLTIGGTPNISGEITSSGFWFIDVTANGMSTGSASFYQVRYRNKQTVGAGSPCNTDIWVVENWHLL